MFYVGIGAFVFGVVLQTLYALPDWFWVMGSVAALCLVLVGWRRSVLYQSGRIFVCVGIAGILLIFGAYRLEFAVENLDTRTLDEVVGKEVTLVGTVNEEPDIRNSQQLLSVEIAESATDLLVSTDRYQSIQYGDVIRVTGVVEKPTNFTTDLGRTFDYVGYLRVRGITHRMSFADVTVVAGGYGNPVIATLLQVKQSFMTQVARYIPEPAAGLSAGLLLGVKQALGDDLETAFRHTGIIHIVVLSGYNVMLVVAFVTTILGYVLPLRSRVVVGLVAITGFALLVGLSATVVRASIMAGLFLLAAVTGRTYQVLRALFVAGLVMVLINPLIVVYDIGFQLSFMATLGLLLIAPRFETMLMQVPQWLGVRNFFMATVATQIAVLPLLMYHIGEVSLVSVPVNMVVLPMVPVAMLLTFIVGLVSYVSSAVALVLAYPAYLSLEFIITVAEVMAAVPYAVIWVPFFSFWWVLIGYTLLGVGLWMWYRRVAANSTATPLALTTIEPSERPYQNWTIVAEADKK